MNIMFDDVAPKLPEGEQIDDYNYCDDCIYKKDCGLDMGYCVDYVSEV